MFPTTIWTVIHQAGDHEPQALEHFAQRYRPVVLDYVRRRGVPPQDAEDLCQEVFVRLFKGNVLARARASRGRFRSLLSTVSRNVLIDWRRRRRPVPVEGLDPVERDPDFDAAWAVGLAERALARLKERESPYHAVLSGHLGGEPQDRNRLWIARRKLIALIRDEVAATCAGADDFEDELRLLAPYLRPKNSRKA